MCDKHIKEFLIGVGAGVFYAAATAVVATTAVAAAKAAMNAPRSAVGIAGLSVFAGIKYMNYITHKANLESYRTFPDGIVYTLIYDEIINTRKKLSKCQNPDISFRYKYFLLPSYHIVQNRAKQEWNISKEKINNYNDRITYCVALNTKLKSDPDYIKLVDEAYQEYHPHLIPYRT
jgi:hypothetical protein